MFFVNNQNYLRQKQVKTVIMLVITIKIVFPLKQFTIQNDSWTKISKKTRIYFRIVTKMDIRTKLVHTFSLLNKRVYFTAVYLKLKISKETMSQDILKFNRSFKYSFTLLKKFFYC